MMFKTCIKCKTDKELNAFTFDAGYYRRKCKTCVNTERRIRLNTNTESALKKKNRDARHYKKHQEKIHKSNRQWAIKNTEKFRAYSKKYKKTHKDVVHALDRTRRLAKIKRVPLWANKETIKKFYIDAAQKTKETGFSWHVDHIIPLQGKLVSGLHVSNNLQVIPGIDNIKKHNKYEVL